MTGLRWWEEKTLLKHGKKEKYHKSINEGF